MFEKINKHMKGQKGSVAEEFHLTKEARWPMPTLEETYWDNPNSSKGHISRCLYKGADVKAEAHYTEGI